MYDTKYLNKIYANTILNSSIKERENQPLETVYMNLYQSYHEKIKINFADGFPNLRDSKAKYHDAGFDSFVTGASFIYFYESGLFKQEEKQSHANKLYFRKSLYSGFLLEENDEFFHKSVNKF